MDVISISVLIISSLALVSSLTAVVLLAVVLKKVVPLLGPTIKLLSSFLGQ